MDPDSLVTIRLSDYLKMVDGHERPGGEPVEMSVSAPDGELGYTNRFAEVSWYAQDVLQIARDRFGDGFVAALGPLRDDYVVEALARAGGFKRFHDSVIEHGSELLAEALPDPAAFLSRPEMPPMLSSLEAAARAASDAIEEHASGSGHAGSSGPGSR